MPNPEGLMSGEELSQLTVAEIFPPKSPSIYGDFDGNIETIAQAENVMDIADIARDVGAELSKSDMQIEKRAYELIRIYKRRKNT